MAHITQIIIEGLLGRNEPIEYKLDKGVNIFFGENGSGKTTLLKVLDAALSQDSAVMMRLPVTRAVVEIYSINFDCTFTRIWERKADKTSAAAVNKRFQMLLDLDEFEIDQRSMEKLLHGASTETPWRQTRPKQVKGQVYSGNFAHSFLPTTRLYLDDRYSSKMYRARSTSIDHDLDQTFGESINRTWLQLYNQTLQEVKSIHESGLMAVLRNVFDPTTTLGTTQTISDQAELYRRVERFLHRQPDSEPINLGSKAAFQKRYQEDTNLRRAVDNLNEVEQRIEFAMEPIDKFMKTIGRLFSRGKRLQISDNELQVLIHSGKTIPIGDLSSGEKHLIKILLETMAAGPNSILIDEPELSMHIDWQRVFVETLQSLNPKAQLILASHSPEVMAEVADKSIFKL